ncbi:MAG: hypothetical protein VYC50_01170 [Pseudomonadota bacterium]|nr:hypothetical protein [Gammaproteobacteria bacterium]MEE2683701.1 hypothetical protein [Pseudomonadota bacterium]|tara:strand:- start:607 stop:1068 length:462 start_codon:yes stop_codon:yes gene_type:complete
MLYLKNLFFVLLFFLDISFSQEDNLIINDEINREGQRCIDTRRLRDTYIVDDSSILFYMYGGDIYRNFLRRECFGLDRYNSFSYEPSFYRLCNLDSITVIEGFSIEIRPTGSRCNLGLFFQISDSDAEFLRTGNRSSIMEEPELIKFSDDIQD